MNCSLHLLTVLALCLLAVCSSGCQPAANSGPAALASASFMPVERTRPPSWQAFGFGPWTAQQVTPGKDQPGQWAFLGDKNFLPSGRFAFELSRGQGDVWQCECASGGLAMAQAISLTDNMNLGLGMERGKIILLGCVFKAPGGQKTWRMSLSGSGGKWSVQGLLSDGYQVSVLIEGSGRLVGRDIPRQQLGSYYPKLVYVEMPSVYTFQDQGQAIAQLSMDGPARFWPGDQGDADHLAAAAAAILLNFER